MPNTSNNPIEYHIEPTSTQVTLNTASQVNRVAVQTGSPNPGGAIEYGAKPKTKAKLVISPHPAQITVRSGSSAPVVGTFVESASRLTAARRISLDGDVTGDTFFDGSDDVTIHATVEKLSNFELEEMLK